MIVTGDRNGDKTATSEGRRTSWHEMTREHYEMFKKQIST